MEAVDVKKYRNIIFGLKKLHYELFLPTEKVSEKEIQRLFTLLESSDQTLRESVVRRVDEILSELEVWCKELEGDDEGKYWLLIARQFGLDGQEIRLKTKTLEELGLDKKADKYLLKTVICKLKNKAERSPSLLKTFFRSDQLYRDALEIVQEIRDLEQQKEVVEFLASIKELRDLNEKPFEMPEMDRRLVSVDELGLSTRIVNNLKRQGIFSVHDLEKLSKEDFLNIRSITVKERRRILAALADRGDVLLFLRCVDLDVLCTPSGHILQL